MDILAAMNQRPTLPLAGLVALGTVFALLAWAPAPAAAQGSHEDHTYQVSFLLGPAGSVDGGSLSEIGYQLGFAVVTNDRGRLVIRAGESDFDTGNTPGSVVNGSFSWVTIGGEYRFTETLYDSGFFIGLGIYGQDGFVLGQGPVDDSTLGLALGVTGEFEAPRDFAVLVELMGHVVPSAPSELFASLMAGVAYKF